MSLTLGPFHFLSFSGTLDDLAAGRNTPDALKDLGQRKDIAEAIKRLGY